MAEVACNDDVVVLDAASGHVVYRRHVPGPADAVAYDPTGRVLAVGTDTGVHLLDPSTGAVRSRLWFPAGPRALARGGPNGAPGRVRLPSAREPPDAPRVDPTRWPSTPPARSWRPPPSWARRCGTCAQGRQLFSLVEPASDHTAAFTPDGKSLVVGTQGPAEVVDVASGKVVKRLTPPGQTLASDQPNPVALRGPSSSSART